MQPLWFPPPLIAPSLRHSRSDIAKQCNVEVFGTPTSQVCITSPSHRCRYGPGGDVATSHGRAYVVALVPPAFGGCAKRRGCVTTLSTVGPLGGKSYVATLISTPFAGGNGDSNATITTLPTFGPPTQYC